MQAQMLVINFVKAAIEACSLYISEMSQLVTSFYNALPYRALILPHSSKFYTCYCEKKTARVYYEYQSDGN
jgi:hypothetical protein